MSTGGESADQVVKMSLEGIQIAANIALKAGGATTKSFAAMLYAILTDKKKSKGKTRLTSLLKSGKELKVFAVRYQDLKRFTLEAKRYGVLYSVLKEKDNTDGICDIMVRAEDAAKISRIVDKFELATVNVDEINASIKKNEGKTPEEFKDVSAMDDKKHEDLVSSLFASMSDKEEIVPSSAKTEKDLLSEQGSNANQGSLVLQKESVHKKLDKMKENRNITLAKSMKEHGYKNSPELPIKKLKQEKEK